MNASATCEWPIRHTRSGGASKHSSASTAARAGRLPWMSEMTAMRIWNVGNVSEVDRGRTRLPIAFVAVAVVAEAAVLLLRPRSGVIDPAPVSARSYFSGAELARAHDFRGPQLALYGGQVLVELGALVLLVRRPPARLRGPFRRPLVAGAAGGAAPSGLLPPPPPPLGAGARPRAIAARPGARARGGWAGA